MKISACNIRESRYKLLHVFCTKFTHHISTFIQSCGSIFVHKECRLISSKQILFIFQEENVLEIISTFSILAISLSIHCKNNVDIQFLM